MSFAIYVFVITFICFSPKRMKNHPFSTYYIFIYFEYKWTYLLANGEGKDYYNLFVFDIIVSKILYAFCVKIRIQKKYIEHYYSKTV